MAGQVELISPDGLRFGQGRIHHFPSESPMARSCGHQAGCRHCV